jgi:hypothetical protein
MSLSGDLKIQHGIDSRRESRWFRPGAGGSNGYRLESGKLRVF